MKLLGGILLIVGTAIGGGMLALPIATSPTGFITSSFLLLLCWVVMTISAFVILEVNLWLPENSNIISMAQKTLGQGGQLVAWISYLLLLYSLLAAYIAGGGDLFQNILKMIHFPVPDWLAISTFTLLFGYVVYHGIKSVDLVNRGLMFLKLMAFVILVSLITPHVSLPQLNYARSTALISSITIAMTSFGFATIIPSLRTYFHEDIKKLRIAILIGSLIPLFCYIVWDIVIMGVIPREGDHGLIAMMKNGDSTGRFVSQLSFLLQKTSITTFAQLFTSVCLLTSFLGVALCLTDFLADGFDIKKTTRNKIFINLLTFLPPLLIVLFYPGAFIKALNYAGIFSLVLLVLLPALMAWCGRYRKNFSGHFQVAGGKLLLCALVIVSGLIVAGNVVDIFVK